MKHFKILAAALALAACTEEPDLDEVEQDLAASYKASIKSRTLTITGTNADSRLALRLAGTTQLVVDVGDDGSADFTFDRSRFDRISIDAGGGADIIRMDESSGAFTTEEQTTINGGAGNDTITGGFGGETISGGAGNDVVTGRGGVDTIVLGDGDDLVIWRPGDGSDVLGGGNGFDRLQFDTANIGEDIELSAAGNHLRLTRNVGTVAMDITGLERVELHTFGGADRVFVRDLAATAVAEVEVDLASTTDVVADEVWVDTTANADTIHVALDGSVVAASGLAAEVRVVGGEPALDRLFINSDAADRVSIEGTAGADTMTATGDSMRWLFDGGGFNVLVSPSLVTPVSMNGLAGDDTITVASSILGSVTLDGGDGNDVLLGGSGPDVLRGGAGDDLVDGRFGVDVADLGDGSDAFSWNPGGGSDVIDGGAGMDTLVMNGAAANEAFDLRAAGPRARLTRDVAGVVLDLGTIERVDLRARSGADSLVIGSLAGSSLAAIDVDLAGADGLPDAMADTIALDGSGGISIIGDGVATGFGGTLRVTHGEASLDRIAVQGGALVIEGTPAADTMLAIGDPSGVLYDGGGYTILVAASPATDAVVKGNGGDDRISAVGSVTTPLVFDGGDGADTLVGGAGPDRLIGGAGNDVVEGRLGVDTLVLGDGNDTMVWNPGDSSDLADGEAGNDTLVFNGANIGETFEISANAARVRLTRNIGTVALDLGSFETLELRARGGADAVLVGDLAGTSIRNVVVDLTGSLGTPDGTGDAVSVVGTAGDDQIAVAMDDAGAVVVSGIPAGVWIVGAELADQLAVHGGPGIDGITVAPTALTVTTFPD